MKNTARAYPLHRKFNLLLHRWHRRIGVMASLFVIWMVISGWLLNHTATLDLAHRVITMDAITEHYGLRNELPQLAFVTDNHWLAVGDDIAILDGKKVDLSIAQPLGMVNGDNLLFIADATRIILFTTNGDLIDNVTAPLTHIERIGNGCDGVVIAYADKTLMTKDGAAWSICNGAVQWSRSAALTPAQRAILSPLLHSGVSIERLLLDLHSGRFLGSWGPYFIDAVGFGLILLALSGLWLFTRHRRLRNSSRR
jgi:hypothetical protein